MISRLLLWFGVPIALGGFIWLSQFGFQTDVDSELSDQSSLSTNFADRDNAAEEVRAVATKINNLEQLIAEESEKSSFERELLKSNLESALFRFQEQSDTSLHRELIDQLIASNEELRERLNAIQSQQNAAFVSTNFNSLAPQQYSWVFPASPDNSTFLQQLGSPAEAGFSSLTTTQPVISNVAAAKKSSRYSIPPTTTLLNATALTALVGRVPIGGRLEDPWRFKLITGADNLAANGHRIPEITGMLWSGTARGDFALSCVSGNVDTAAFIFIDGTIQTVESSSNSEDRLTSGLGWISDARGNPCIAGDLKTNALQFLAQSTLVKSSVAAAQAVSQAQTTTSTNSAGQSNQNVTGDIDEYVAGYAVEQALSEIGNWLDNRQQSSFDAVYVPAGQPVAIHIEKMIEIDYDNIGRKVRHPRESSRNSYAHMGLLD